MLRTNGRWAKGVIVAAVLICGVAYVLARTLWPADAAVESLRVEVLQRYPHDPGAFTQGLELYDGKLYESTGLYGESSVRITDLATGAVERLVRLSAQHFGEGLTVVDGVVWQITWQEGTAYRWDAQTLQLLGQVSYPGEGWGICYDEGRDQLIMSDGSAQLTFRHPQTFAPLSTVSVTLDGQPQLNINELECVDGAVWANIWLTDDIVRIDPASGQVTAVVDASGLLNPQEGVRADVLNGIAWIEGSDEFIVTGKLWPWSFRVRFVP